LCQKRSSKPVTVSNEVSQNPQKNPGRLDKITS
jgi:hypothetical protein